MGSLVPLLWLVHGITAAISVPLVLRWVPPNGLYGFRVPATLADRRVWYAANAASGGWLLLATVASALFSALYLRGRSGDLAPVVPLAFFTFAVLAAAGLSFASLRRIAG